MLEYAAGLKYFLFLALDGKYPLSDVEPDHGWGLRRVDGVADLPVEFAGVAEAQPSWREASVAGRPVGMVLRQFPRGRLHPGKHRAQSVWQQQRNVVAYWRAKATEERARRRAKPSVACGIFVRTCHQ